MDSFSLEKLGYLFYIANPNRTSFEKLEDVPEYTVQVIPYFAVLVLLEQFVRYKKRMSFLHINDAIVSLFQGMTEELCRVVLKVWQIAIYIYIYNEWRVATLPWDSAWTWWTCFILVDFFYYWAHRASHEINFLWAAHQVHHSSEHYNLTTALRQSVIQGYLLPFFYLPMAFAVPPSVYLVHSQLNLLYQFWIHTEVISSLGPLEYILNTASHHRVHHGRNRYCIDKNYGGTLIIWDRLFGTFEPEGEEVVYGLTHPINTFETFYIQLCHYLHIWSTFLSIEGWRNKLSALVKGPGWQPGTAWHGNPEDIPDVKAPVEKYHPKLPTWCTVYVLCHFLLLLLGYKELMEIHEFIPKIIVYASIIYQLFSFSIIGILLEGRAYAPCTELLRCISYFVMDYYFLPFSRLSLLSKPCQMMIVVLYRATFGLSIVFWLTHCIRSISIKLYSKKIE